MFLLCCRNSKVALVPRLWADVECQKVDKLPYDIDGLVKYQIPFEKKSRMESSKDGRPWAAFMTSRRSGFFGVRRLARCKGSSECVNDECPYLKQFSKRNRVQFQNKGGETVCHSCGAPAVNVACHASKVWEFKDKDGVVDIYHHGTHTCVPRPSHKMSMETSENATATFKTAKKLGLKAYASAQIIQAVQEGKNLNDVMNLASDLAPNKVLRVKEKVKKSMNSAGHSFDALAKYKVTTDKLDKFLVYKAMNGQLSSGLSYVFKSSETQLQMALSMDKDGDGILSKEVCFADGNHKRCPRYITLTLWVSDSVFLQNIYDPLPVEYCPINWNRSKL
jgi:hypothetical protein